MFESNVSFVLLRMTHWHNTCPSLRTSKKLSGSPDVFNGKPVTLLTHSKHSWARSSLYLLFIYNKINVLKVNSRHWTRSTECFKWLFFILVFTIVFTINTRLNVYVIENILFIIFLTYKYGLRIKFLKYFDKIFINS